MQALILCRSNIQGIRANPEGYGGAYPAPRQCNIWKLVRTLTRRSARRQSCIEGVRLLLQALTAY